MLPPSPRLSGRPHFAFHRQIVEETLVVANAIDGISQSMNVPVVYLDTVGQDFTTTTLLGDNRRRATLHGLQGEIPKGSLTEGMT